MFCFRNKYPLSTKTDYFIKTINYPENKYFHYYQLAYERFCYISTSVIHSERSDYYQVNIHNKVYDQKYNFISNNLYFYCQIEC